MNSEVLQRAIYMFKTAGSTKVTVSKDGKSWTFPSMEAASRYFSFISSFSQSQISKMIEDREQYICGFYVNYDE